MNNVMLTIDDPLETVTSEFPGEGDPTLKLLATYYEA
jgi:hypothetical protein